MILNKVNEMIGLLLEYYEKDWDLILNVEKKMTLITPLTIFFWTWIDWQTYPI